MTESSSIKPEEIVGALNDGLDKGISKFIEVAAEGAGDVKTTLNLLDGQSALVSGLLSGVAVASGKETLGEAAASDLGSIVGAEAGAILMSGVPVVGAIIGTAFGSIEGATEGKKLYDEMIEGTEHLTAETQRGNHVSPSAEKTSPIEAGRLYDIAMSAGGSRRFGTGLQEVALRHGHLSPGGFAPVAPPRSAPPQRAALRAQAEVTAPGAVQKAEAGSASPPGIVEPPVSQLGPKYRKIIDEAKAQAAEARAKRGVAPPQLHGRGLAPGLHHAVLPRHMPRTGADGMPARTPPGGQANPPRPAAEMHFDEAASLATRPAMSPPFPAESLNTQPQPPQTASFPGMAATGQQAAPAPITRETLGEALDEYFYRQSHLAPNGGPGFNPALTPLWAGLKIPG